MDWKKEALSLYKEGHKITTIANRLGKSRKTVSEYINRLPELQKVNAARKEQSEEKRKVYKRNWKRSAARDAALLKRQHEIDVMVLSREQYFNE